MASAIGFSIASAPNYISESPASRDKAIGASFVVIALTVCELWVPRDAPTQHEQSIVLPGGTPFWTCAFRCELINIPKHDRTTYTHTHIYIIHLHIHNMRCNM